MSMLDLSRAAWQKSSRSQQNGSCVEVARNLPSIVAIRDSKDPASPALIVNPKRWVEFTADLKAI